MATWKGPGKSSDGLGRKGWTVLKRDGQEKVRYDLVGSGVG